MTYKVTTFDPIEYFDDLDKAIAWAKTQGYAIVSEYDPETHHVGDDLYKHFPWSE